MSTLALSTMWMQGRFSSVRDFVESGKRLGFESFELGHVVRPEMLNGLSRQSAEFPSIHAPCPTTIGLGSREDIVLSSLDEDRRSRAVDMAVETMNLAERLGARVVIVHVGHVDIGINLDDELRRLFIAEQEDSEEYLSRKQELMDLRAGPAPANLDAVCRSLEVLTREADRRGLRLAMENRVYYFEIPILEEAQALLGEFGRLSYWHDTGHAQVLQNLGFSRHQDWLDQFAGRAIGVHLHDALGVRDHLVAGLGDVDWALVCQHLTPNLLRTCEFDWYFQEEHLLGGVEFLRDADCTVT